MTKKPVESRFKIEGGQVVINDPCRERIRAMISNIYGIQKLRIQCGNRMVASYMDLASKSRERLVKAKEVELEAEETDDMTIDSVDDADGLSDEEAKKRAREEKEANKKLKLIMAEYGNITNYIKSKIKARGKLNEGEAPNIHNKDIQKALEELREASESGEAEAKGLPSIKLMGEVYDYLMADQYQKLLDLEQSSIKYLEEEVKKHPMWSEFFADVKGCGPIMAAVCISYFDPYRARHASSFWKYAGLDVVIKADGTAEGRGRKHTEPQKYMDKEGKIQEKIGLTYNPKLRSKLLGVLGGCFLKLARDSEKRPIQYGKVYYDYKHRLANRLQDPPLSTPHIHRMALRYCVKQFVRDMWVAWRTLEGLEVTEPYEVAYLDRNPHGYNSGLPTYTKA